MSIGLSLEWFVRNLGPRRPELRSMDNTFQARATTVLAQSGTHGSPL